MAVSAMTRTEKRKPWWQWWLIAAADCAIAMAWGVPVHARSDAIIWEGNDQSVLLAPQDDAAAPPNDHPATVTPQEIESMLARLSFRHADQQADTAPAAVFNKEQVEILGEALAAGLTRAKPSQDVTFSIIGAHRLSPGAVARRNRLTAGRVFFRQGKLNIIFGEVQSPYRKKNLYGRIDEDFYPREYGSRAPPEEQEAVLIANPNVSLQLGAAGTRVDWVVFDPAVAGTAPLSRPADATAGDDRGSGPAAPDNSPPAPATAAPAAVATSEEAARQREATAPEASNSDSIEQRLKYLKSLREKDLISEEAYRQKVNEILESL